MWIIIVSNVLFPKCWRRGAPLSDSVPNQRLFPESLTHTWVLCVLVPHLHCTRFIRRPYRAQVADWCAVFVYSVMAQRAIQTQFVFARQNLVITFCSRTTTCVMYSYILYGNDNSARELYTSSFASRCDMVYFVSRSQRTTCFVPKDAAGVSQCDGIFDMLWKTRVRCAANGWR